MTINLEADQESEKIITQSLLKSYPKYKTTAEESGSNNIESEYEWFIDPLDAQQTLFMEYHNLLFQ